MAGWKTGWVDGGLFTFSPAKKLSLSLGADLAWLELAMKVDTLQENCGDKHREQVQIVWHSVALSAT